MRHRLLPAAFALGTALALGGCGGGGFDSEADVRLVNATLTHAQVSLGADQGSGVGATAINTASGYANPATGTRTFTVNDATSNVALTTTTLDVGRDKHYAIVAYESGGVVKTTTVDENAGAPASGTTSLNVVDAAIEAGGIDVYVALSSVDITTLTSPTFTFAAGTSQQTGTAQSFAPGTYRLRVTGAGNPNDVRLDIASFVVASQQIATVVVSPTAGGTLVNGAVIVQQGSYTDGHNTKARLRLVSAVSSGSVSLSATSAASSGTVAAPTPVFTAVPSASVSAYVLVQGGATLAVTVAGAAVAAPPGPAAGADATLVVHGDPGAATAVLVNDDNHLPASTSFRVRLLNGLTGTSDTLSLASSFAAVATGVAPGAASGYGVVTAGTSVRLDVTDDQTLQSLYSQSGLTVTGGAVYTFFVLGTTGGPSGALRQDR